MGESSLICQDLSTSLFHWGESGGEGRHLLLTSYNPYKNPETQAFIIYNFKAWGNRGSKRLSCPRSVRKWLREDLNLGFSAFSAVAFPTSLHWLGYSPNLENEFPPICSSPSSLRRWPWARVGYWVPGKGTFWRPHPPVSSNYTNTVMEWPHREHPSLSWSLPPALLPPQQINFPLVSSAGEPSSYNLWGEFISQTSDAWLCSLAKSGNISEFHLPPCI